MERRADQSVHDAERRLGGSEMSGRDRRTVRLKADTTYGEIRPSTPSCVVSGFSRTVMTYVVSGFSRTVMTYVVSGFSRTVMTYVVSGFSRTVMTYVVSGFSR